MARLIIEVTGSKREIERIATHLCDGGGEEQMCPSDFEEEEGRVLDFNYAECFESHGYTGDGEERKIEVLVAEY